MIDVNAFPIQTPTNGFHQVNRCISTRKCCILCRVFGVCPSACVLFFLSLTQRLCDPCATSTLRSHCWLTRSLPLPPSPRCLWTSSHTTLPSSPLPRFHAASMSKRSTAHCMECATVRRLYGAVCSRLHENLLFRRESGGRGAFQWSIPIFGSRSSHLFFCWKNEFERGGRMTYCHRVLVIYLYWMFSVTLNNHSTSTRHQLCFLFVCLRVFLIVAKDIEAFGFTFIYGLSAVLQPFSL